MKKSFILGTLLLLGACGMGSGQTSGPEPVSVSLKRTHKYLDFVEKAKQAQEALNSFVQGEQKGCEGSGKVLQLTPEGVLSCVVPPKSPATPTTPEASKK